MRYLFFSVDDFRLRKNNTYFGRRMKWETTNVLE